MIPPRIILYLLRYLEEPNAERQKPGACQGLGARGMGSSCVMGSSWWMGVPVLQDESILETDGSACPHCRMNLLRATGLYP